MNSANITIEGKVGKAGKMGKVVGLHVVLMVTMMTAEEMVETGTYWGSGIENIKPFEEKFRSVENLLKK